MLREEGEMFLGNFKWIFSCVVCERALDNFGNVTFFFCFRFLTSAEQRYVYGSFSGNRVESRFLWGLEFGKESEEKISSGRGG